MFYDFSSDTNLDGLLRKARDYYGEDVNRKASSINKDFQEAMYKRYPFDQSYNNASKYVGLRTGDFGRHTTQPSTPDPELHQNLFDSSATKYRNELAGKFFSSLFSPTKPWFNLESAMKKNKPLTSSEEKTQKEYYQKCEEIIMPLLVKHGFYPKLHSTFIEYVTFGMGVFYAQLDKKNNKLKFKSISLRNCYFETNDDEEIDTCFRIMHLRPRQVLSMFQDSKNEVLLEFLEALSDSEQYRNDLLTLVHAVRPRLKSEKSYTLLDYESCYFIHDFELFIKEEGYSDFPYFILRWDNLPEQIYCTGPGELAVPDARSLNQIMEHTFNNARTITAPAYVAPADTFIGPISTASGSVNLYDPDRGYQQKLIEPLLTGGDYNVGIDFAQHLKSSISEKFSKNALEEQKRAEMTATEFSGRELDRLQELIPQYVRILSEFGIKIVQFIYNSYESLGYLPDKPESITSNDVNFVSELARAQERASLISVSSAINDLSVLANIKPEIMDSINADEYAKLILKKHDTPVELYNSEEEINQIRSQRQQNEQQNQDIARLAELSKARGAQPQ